MVGQRRIVNNPRTMGLPLVRRPLPLARTDTRHRGRLVRWEWTDQPGVARQIETFVPARRIDTEFCCNRYWSLGAGWRLWSKLWANSETGAGSKLTLLVKVD